MKFRLAVERVPAIADYLRDGLQALRQTDRRRLMCDDSRLLAGSLDLDSTLRTSYPQDPRWDYGIGIRVDVANDLVLWLEVHTASSHGVTDVLKKLQWLKDWINTEAPVLRQLRTEFRWVASGRISFRRGSQEARRLAQKGLRFPTRQLNLDSLS